MSENKWVVIRASSHPVLEKMLDAFLTEEPVITIDPRKEEGLSEELLAKGLYGKRVVFGVSLDPYGLDHTMLRFVTETVMKKPSFFQGAIVSLLLYGESELFTKSYSNQFFFLLNALGAVIPGHPLVEAIKDFSNFKTWKKTMDLPLEDICYIQCSKAAQRLSAFSLKKKAEPRLLVLHASNAESSNTLALWRMVKAHLSGIDIHEVHVENGSIEDCIGCGFKACLHFGQQQRCFYGGTMVESIYPEIEKADGVVWLSPNYNDAASANLMAVVNRLTALYRVTPFYDKLHFSIVVSGNSGGDSVVKQLMNALCTNKGFTLSPRSFLTATANDPGSIHRIPEIPEKAEAFAKGIEDSLKGFISPTAYLPFP